MNRSFIYFLSLVLFVASCQKRDFKSISPQEFKELIVDTTIQRLDVRTFEEYNEAHIMNAHFLDVGDSLFVERVDSVLNKDYPVAVYCRTGRRSKDAAAILSEKGYKVYEMNGGITEWKNLSYPLISE